jgi:hypothetical protein
VLAQCAEAGVPVGRIGEVGGASLDVADQFTIGLDELRTTSEATMPALFG